MDPQIATVACALGIMGLFVLERNREQQTSKAFWMAVAWLLIGGSRNVSEWLDLRGPTDAVDRYLEGNPIDRAVLMVLLTVGMSTLISRGQRVGAIVRANRAILAFFLYCGLSILWSDYQFVSFKRWIRGLGDVVMVLVILTDRNSLAAIKRAFSRAGFLLLPLSVLFIRYYPDLGRAYGRDGTPSWTGVATGKNSLGMTCLIFGLFSVWRILIACRGREGTRRSRTLVAHGVMVAIALWLLWIADSKTSLVCFGLGAALMTATAFTSLRERIGVLRATVIGLVFATAGVLFLGIGGGIVDAMGRDSSLTGRTAIWSLVLSVVQNPWFGTGYESFWMESRLVTMNTSFGVNQAHNGYIEIYLNLGWTGVALLAFLIVKSYRSISSGLSKHLEVCELGLAYFVVAIVYNFTEAMFKMMSPVWIAFLLATMAAPHPRPKTINSVTPERGFYRDFSLPGAGPGLTQVKRNS